MDHRAHRCAPMRRTRAPYRRVRASMVRRTAPQHGISERIQRSPNPFGVQPFRCPGERGAGGYINLRSFVLWWSGAGGGALTIELAIAMQDECDGMMSALEAALTDLNDNCASRKEFLVAVKAVRSHRVHACVRTSPSVQMCWTFERQYCRPLGPPHCMLAWPRYEAQPQVPCELWFRRSPSMCGMSWSNPPIGVGLPEHP